MKIMWIVNIVFPEALSLISKGDKLRATGGWMLGAANALLKHNDVELSVVSVSSLVSKLEILKGKSITYYVIPIGKGNMRRNPEYRKYFREIQAHYSPDVVHIHGTEYSHGLAYIEECGNEHVVVSIQGMTSVYAKYHLHGLTAWNIIKNISIRDILKHNTLFQDKMESKHQGEYEIEMLKSIKHVIGRTSWDRAHTWAINPDLTYHFCNEILRDCFYYGRWNYYNCEKHSIFCSSAQDPVKGFHQLLKALPIVKQNYPQVKVYVSGHDITREHEKHGFIRRGGYGNIIKSIIKKNGLENNIVFLGPLDAEEMKKQYLNANVFICPSSIENSPNSLGEAQILGTPCVASYTGGVMDMMIGNERNIYRYEEVEMLAYKICQVFASEGNQINMVETAKRRHDPFINSKSLLDIYKTLL